MYKTASLDLREASNLIESVLRFAAKEAKPPVAVAVVDREGNLITFARMDGASAIIVEMALNKAYTAARLGRSTKDLADQINRDNLQLTMFGNPRYTYFGGGQPIVLEKEVVGGLGISGRSESEDIALGEQALRPLAESQHSV